MQLLTRGRPVSLWLIALLLLSAGLVAACGNDDDDTPDPTATTAASDDAADDASPEPAPDPTPEPTPDEVSDEPRDTVSVTMQQNWFPQPENSGELAALVLGYYPDWLEVEVRDGGPGIPILELLATGQVQFALCDAASMMIAQEAGIELVGLLAAFQTNPQILYAHTSAGLTGFEDMAGKPVAVSATALFYEFLQATYGWDEADRVTYQGTIAPFLTNEDLVQQGYFTSEPFFIRETAPEVDFEIFMIADSGYNPYASLLCTTREMVEDDPETVAAMVEGAWHGWQAIVDTDLNGPVMDEIKARNPDHEDDSLAYSVSEMPGIMFTEDTEQNTFGYMTAERMELLHDQLVELGVLEGPLDWESVYTNEFLPSP